MINELPIHSSGEQSFLAWPLGALSVWKVETYLGRYVATFATEAGARRFASSLPKMWGDYRCAPVRRTTT